MLKSRVLPILLMRSRGLVKGENFKNHKYVGDPINAVRIFNEKEVDEIAIIDIEATRINKEPDYNFIEEIAAEAFMPISYGGGIQNVKHVEKLFRIGIEKIIINTAFFKNPNLVKECSRIAGSQSIIVGIDVKKTNLSQYQVFIENGLKKTGYQPIEYAQKAQLFGAGEIILTSIDREGSGHGLDLALIKQVSEAIDLPIIAQGGVNNLDHIKQGVMVARASAVGVGSFFIFHGKHKAVLLTYPSCEDLEEIT